MDKNISKPISKPVATGLIVIDDKKILELMLAKEATVNEGRAKSAEIDEVQKQIDALIEKEYEITAKVVPEELIQKGEALKEKINEMIKELDTIASDIRTAKLSAIPKEIETEHLKLNDQREKLEQERNKLALKVQKIKDKMVPKLQKIVKPQLAEYEDLLSADIKEGKVVVEKFSHLEEWKQLWANKQKEAKI